MVDPDRIVSALLAIGVAACLLYGYVAGRGSGVPRQIRADPPTHHAGTARPPAGDGRCVSVRRPRAGGPRAARPRDARPRDAARPYARREPRRRADRNL
jgi:hypothetical protein